MRERHDLRLWRAMDVNIGADAIFDSAIAQILLNLGYLLFCLHRSASLFGLIGFVEIGMIERGCFNQAPLDLRA
jgi:hypothetical protein